MKTIYSIILVFAFTTTALLADGVCKVLNATNTYLYPQSVLVQTDINNQIATTVSTQVFLNTTGKRAVLQYAFPLNASAVVTQIRFKQAGTWRTATLEGKAQDTIKGNSGGAQDVFFTNIIGNTPFVLTVKDTLSVTDTLIAELTYIELLPYENAEMIYEYPFSYKGYVTAQATLGFTCSITSQKGINAVTGNLSKLTFTTTQNSSRGGVELLKSAMTTNIVIHYAVSQTDLGATLLSSKPAGEDGYFTLLIEPDPKTQSDKILKKVFTFIIDVSGSMDGVKLQQAKDAAIYCIQHLNAADEFNIIPFSDMPMRYKQTPVSATSTEIALAVSYIQSLTVRGGTNIQDALTNGLSQYINQETSNIIIFLTDGIADVKTDVVKAQNKQNVRIFVFGIGNDVNKQLLTDIALSNNGFADFITQTENTGSKISGFFNKIKNPLLQNIAIAFAPTEVFEVYPQQLPDIFVGEQLVVCGRYKTAGNATVTLTGKGTEGKDVTYNYNLTFTGDSLVNRFVPKVWAKKKIDVLLVLMTREGGQTNRWKEWKEEVIRLGLKYGIVTPFTNFSDPGNNSGGGTVSDVEEKIKNEQLNVQAYPNPFATTTALSLSLQTTQHVVIKIYDELGNLVCIVIDGILQQGNNTIDWNGTDLRGAPVANGIYFAEITISNHTRRSVLAKQ